MNPFLQRIASRLIRTGNFALTDASGRTFEFGDGSGERVHIVLHTRHAERAIALDPSLGVPECYMDGEMDFAEGDVFGLMRIAFQNSGPSGSIDVAWTRALDGLRHALRRFQQVNTAKRAKRNVQRHYDLSNELYRLFLDPDMQYSCAYFERPGITLEEAQLAKKRHIAAKLAIEPGHTILDIGSGWGGLGLYLARSFQADVLGVTLSEEQHSVATERARQEGLEDHVHFELRDYRDLGERFDRIVSVGMFEHVGVNHYRTFFERCATLLKPDGVMLLHTIGRSGPPASTTPFTRKYIFPGGYIPAMSEAVAAIERSGLIITDVEVLRLHYAETLKHWRERFAANRDRAKAIYDERFCRMWEFYLGASEAAFRWQGLVVFQFQLAHGNDTLPITRSYMDEREKALKLHEIGHRPPSGPTSRPKRRKVSGGK